MDRSREAVKVYEKIAKSYAEAFYKPSEHIDEFLGMVTKNGKILDVGCGPGIDSAYMAPKGFSVTGIDLSKKMIELAKKRAPEANFKVADMRKLDFKPNSFDGILVSFSLIHLPKKDVPHTLETLHKILKPGGAVYIGIQEGESRELSLTEPLKPDEKMFLNVMSSGELLKLVEAAGFSVTSTHKRPPTGERGELDFNKFVVLVKKQ